MAAAPTRILVVDDNDASRFVKVQILRRAGYLVTEARTGAGALASVQVEQPDLAVLDVNLPDISGLEICRRLKDSENTPAIQVLQVSQTAVTDADRALGLDLGADMYLIEPVGAQVLLASVRALVRARRAEEELNAAADREREARAEAERANKLKDEFVAMVSHELRTPLNAMTGWIWQLKRGALDEDGYRRAIDVLDRNARVQTQLINDLLDVSRISAGTLDVDLQPVSLQPIIATTVDTALDSPSHKRKQIRVTLNVPDAPIFVRADAARLLQVVTNILNNAFQFTPAGGSIVIDCGVKDGQAFVRVCDTGAGIDPAFLPHVFERFRQARALASGPDRGLGLGLAIVHYLMELHHGQVTLESEGLGRGTVCTITLPLVDERAVAAAAANDWSPSTLKGLQLLLVEDDADARDVLQSILTGYGAVVTTADSAAAAEAAFPTRKFDVLVTDIGLPDIRGDALLQRLRAKGFVAPAVAVTAFATEGDKRRLRSEGFLAHVAKPVEPERLARAVAEVAHRADENR
jgi:signal transduction histidine kinase/BarA-like signal transduction histidine kinase